MAIFRVQGNALAGHAATSTITLPAGIRAGSLVVAGVSIGANATPITPPDGSWQRAAYLELAGGNSAENAIYYLLVDAAHAGQTSWTWTIPVSHTLNLYISEWRSTAGWPASPVDQVAVSSAVETSSTTMQSGTTNTTTQGNELWIAAVTYEQGLQTESNLTSGWTRDGDIGDDTNKSLVALYQIVGNTDRAAVSFTVPTAKDFWGCVVTFKDASGNPRWHRPRYIMRGVVGSIFTPFQAIPAWVDRALGANFVRQTSPTNIPRYVIRAFGSTLINYGLNITTRFRLGLLNDIATRFVLGTSGTQSIRDIASRFRLMQQSVRDVATRFRLKSADQFKDVATRFRLAQQRVKDVATRFRLAKLNDIASRFR